MEICFRGGERFVEFAHGSVVRFVKMIGWIG